MKEKQVSKILVTFVLISILFSPMLPSSTTTITADTDYLKRNTAQDEDTQPHLTQPTIYHEDTMDTDSNRIQDRLEEMISNTMTADESASLPVVVTLYNPVTNHDLNWFAMLGGYVTHVYSYVTYGFAGLIPASNITWFVSLEKDNLCIIEYDAPVQYNLDISVPLIRARPIVWNTYGYTGSPNHSIAIIDTGIDDSHPDVGPYGDLNFSRKIVGWHDATPDMATTPEDYGEHGTHVAGIAAGTGDANPLQTSGFTTTTWTYKLSGLFPGQGWIHYGFDVMKPGLITLTCMWTSGNTIFLQLRDATGNTVLKQTSGSEKPLVLTYYATASGRYRPVVGVLNGLGLGYFSLGETYPYQGKDDGYNLFTGVAPTSKLVGVKVFDNTGSGTTSTVYGGMDWIIANKHIYNITVASMSLSLENGAVDTTFDQKADTMVENGIITVVSAGNDYPDYTIGSPGTAAYVITVGATNDQNGITSYSSNGDPTKNEYGLVKPDVTAPGGSTGVGNLIISADSSDVDYGYSGQSDFTANDYQQMSGTSMSTPYVSGLAALMINALSNWNWTKEEALKVKMIISMTAFEVQNGESTNQPPLNRGDKDSKEGYGRISADAAIEAITLTYDIGENALETFGSAPFDKKVWARQIQLTAMKKYKFHLLVPSAADYDLYLYDGNPDDYGQPIISARSINVTQGADEAIQYTSTESGTYYIVVKWVEGEGTFNLQSESLPVPDVAVVNVLPSATSAFVGGIVNITVTVKNEGDTTESFNVTAYFNNSIIQTQIVSNLTVGTLKNLTFSWNTTNVTPCTNYTISAEADVVPNEVDTVDNIYIDGTVKIKVKLVGDVNDDGIVDIADLATAAMSYHAEEGDPEYNPEADINKDGIINVIDLAMIGVNYGKTC